MNSENHDKTLEEALKNTAITFSNEGIVKDLKEIVSRKMNHQIRLFRELSELISILNSSKDKVTQKMVYHKDSPISKLLSVFCEDITYTFYITNALIKRNLEDIGYVEKPKDSDPKNPEPNDEQ